MVKKVDHLGYHVDNVCLVTAADLTPLFARYRLTLIAFAAW